MSSLEARTLGVSGDGPDDQDGDSTWMLVHLQRGV